jgi:nicotinate phosphoribosyltransferase
LIELANIALSSEELEFLRTQCKYLTANYLEYIGSFRFRPSEQVQVSFTPNNDTGSDSDIGPVVIRVAGSWVDTILYEIPLLALISETYFKFCDRSWSYDGQLELAQRKGEQLLKGGCVFSEFGSRRRRDYKTQELVLKGLVEASQDGERIGWSGKLSGTSNVHFAMRFGLPPIGTVAHEWFMGVAAITGDYEHANEIALKYWVGTFGPGVGVSLMSFAQFPNKQIGPRYCSDRHFWDESFPRGIQTAN